MIWLREDAEVGASDWTYHMVRVAEYAQFMAKALINRDIFIRYETGRGDEEWQACYGNAVMTFNLDRLGSQWFLDGLHEGVHATVLHELAHDASQEHYSYEYITALESISGKAVSLALHRPDLFERFK